MFGLLHGSSCRLKHNQRREWQGHICGLCLSLRDNYGHTARIATNYDAAVLSVLYSAQTAVPPPTYTSYCPLRRQRKAEITAPNSVGAGYASSVALVMAATKIQDHVVDGESFWRHIPQAANFISSGWMQRANKQAIKHNFDLQTLHNYTIEQIQLEADKSHDFYTYSRPTELAVAATFRHTAVLTHNPHNEAPLFEMGRMFGRIMYLLDSIQDLASDVANNIFNPLITCYQETKIFAKAQGLFEEAHSTLLDQFAQLDLRQPSLAQSLFDNQLRQRGNRVLGLETHSAALHFARNEEDIDQDKKKPGRQNDGFSPDCDCGFFYCGDCSDCNCDGKSDCCNCFGCDNCGDTDCGGCDCDAGGCDCN